MRRPLAVFASVLVLTACGTEGRPGGPDADTTVPPPTQLPAATSSPAATDPSAAPAAPVSEAKVTFVRQANAICREAEQRVNALTEPAKVEDVPSWMRGFIAILDELQAKFRRLALPPGDEPELDHYLDGNDEQVAALKASLPELDAGARDKDERRVDAALEKAFDVYGRVAADQEPFVQSYGFTDCGEDPPDRATA